MPLSLRVQLILAPTILIGAIVLGYLLGTGVIG